MLDGNLVHTTTYCHLDTEIDKSNSHTQQAYGLSRNLL